MSNLFEQLEGHKANIECGANVEEIIDSTSKDLGGFNVSRVMPYRKDSMIGPWIFFDHMGPAKFSADQAIDVRPHPHINLCTVTYLFEGEIRHKDSVGSNQVIKAGAINLMVAGKGIVHSERTPDNIRGRPHRAHGLQLWHALPLEFEEIDPAFYHYGSEELPKIKKDGIEIKILMGELFDNKSPVKTFTNTNFAEMKFDKEQILQLESTQFKQAIYIVSGEIEIDNIKISSGKMAIIRASSKITISSISEAHIILIGGRDVGRRYIWWNFVSSREDRIEQAKLDWQNGKFAKVEGDDEFIPLPDK